MHCRAHFILSLLVISSITFVIFLILEYHCPWSLVVFNDKMGVLGPGLGLEVQVVGPGVGIEDMSLVVPGVDDSNMLRLVPVTYLTH